METESIITIIICVAIMGLAIWYYWKACQTYDKAEEIRFKAEVEKADLESKLDDAYDNAPNPDLGEVTFRIKDEYFACSVQAVFPTLAGTMPITIKEYMKGLDDDGYARREAEYLLSILNEK